MRVNRCNEPHPDYHLVTCSKNTGHAGSHEYHDGTAGISWNRDGTSFHPPLSSMDLLKMGQRMARDLIERPNFPSVIEYGEAQERARLRERQRRLFDTALALYPIAHKSAPASASSDAIARAAVVLADALINQCDRWHV